MSLQIFSKEIIEKEMIKIFNGGQRLATMETSVKFFIKIYAKWWDKDEYEKFMDVFLSFIKCVLICPRTSPFTKRSLEFVSLLFKEMLLYEEIKENERLHEIAANDALGKIPAPVESVIDDEIGNEIFDAEQTIIDKRYTSPPLNTDLMVKDFILNFLSSEDINIRFNTIILLKRFVEFLDEIDEETYREMLTKLVERSFDKCGMVRAQVISCLRKFQDAEKDDKAIEVIKYHLNFDPNPFVRVCAIRVIVMSVKTLPDILMATKDCNHSVRKYAYKKIADKSGIVNYMLSDRHMLLKQGFYDWDNDINEMIIKYLIPNWISNLDNDIITFLEYLNIKEDEVFYNELLKSYFYSLTKSFEKNITDFHIFVFKFKGKFMNEHKLLNDNFTEETVYFWCQLCVFCKSNNITYEKQVSDDYILEDLLDEILPDIPIFCTFVDKFMNLVTSNSNVSANIDVNFVFTQLLHIGSLYKIKDIAQWNRIMRTFKAIILNDNLYLILKDSYIELIYQIFYNYFQDDHQHLLDFTLDLINTINNPEIYCEYSRIVNSTFVDQETKPNILQIDESQITKSSYNTYNFQERMESDPKILERCLNIFNSFLHVRKPKKNLSLLPGLINRMILPNLTFKDSEKIRILAIKALGNYCCASIELINHFLKVFVEIIEEEKYMASRVEALKYICDFLCLYGFEKIHFIDIRDLDTSNGLNTSGVNNESFYNFMIDTLTTLLNEPNFDHVFMMKNLKTRIEYQLFETSVTGVCKLMILGRLNSNEMLCQLINIYVTYQNIEVDLKQNLKFFFYRYYEKFEILKKKFNFKMSPFIETYVKCFKIFLKNERNLKDYDLLLNIILKFTPEDNVRQLIFESIEIYELTFERELVVFHLKFLMKFMQMIKLEKDELRELKKKFEEFRQRYVNHHELRDKKKSLDKGKQMFDKVIENIKLSLHSGNQSIIEEENEEPMEEEEELYEEEMEVENIE